MTQPGSTVQLRWSPGIGALIDLAIEEDIGRGDPTTEVMGLAGELRRGAIICRAPAVACGLQLAPWVLQRARSSVDWLPADAVDGDELQGGEVMARLQGPVDEMLVVERTLLNFLMRMCGVATLTRRFVNAVQGTGTRVVDTRKTLPGWRALDKHAVRVGGGANHRFDLSSGILLKDNHIAACSGSVHRAVRRALDHAPHPLRVEVEVETLEQARQARDAGAEVLLLDNMSPAQVTEVVAALGERCPLLEVSGGIGLRNVREYAQAGAAIISVGALTHSAVAADLSLELEG